MVVLPMVMVLVAPVALKFTCTCGPSSSLIDTVVSAGLPALTPAGSVPKPSFTLSPSSSTVSSVAVNVMLCSLSPLSNVTLASTPL